MYVCIRAVEKRGDLFSVSSELDFPALIFTGRLNPLCHVRVYNVYEMDGQIGGQV